MSDIKKVLARLNKSREESDQFKIASEQEDNYFDWKFYDSGSDILNEFLGGGVPIGLVLLTGKKGSGKTSFALTVAKDVTLRDKYVVYFDGEHSVKKSSKSFPAKDLGVKMDRFIHHKGSNLEEMLDAAEAFATSEDVGMIVIDSIKAFNPTAMEEKSAEQTGMGNQARKYGERINILLDLCERRNILLLGINQWRTDLGVTMGDNRTLPGGAWQEYFACKIIDFTKKDLILDENKAPIGHEVHVRIKKSKVLAVDPKEVVKLKFYYGVGFDKVADSVELLIQNAVIEKRGGWYYFPEIFDQDKIQGKDSLIQHIKDNPELLKELKSWKRTRSNSRRF
jgi:recombination protein RecA